MPFGLQNQTIDQIRGVFARHPEVRQAILYGSRAIGTQRDGSDIDLALTGTALNLKVLTRIEIELDDLLLPYEFDLSIRKQISNDSLRNHIDRVGVLFYDRECGSTADHSGAAMKTVWTHIRLDELTEPDSPITYGVVKPGEPGDVLFIRGGDVSHGRVLDHQLRTITQEVSEQYKRTLLRGGEILMCLVGQPGQVAVAPTTLAGANIARQVGLIRLRSDINAEFITYFLRSPDGQAGLGTHTGGSVQQVINLGDLKTVTVPVPPLAEQQRIVRILDEAFEGIATAKANAEKNLQNARALFESHLHSVFSQRGPGWVETTIGDQLTLQRGFDITKDQQKTGEVPVVSSGGIKSYHDKAMAKGPGVVIGRKGTLVKVFYLENDYWPHDTTLWVKDFKGNQPRFVYYLFAGLDVRKLDSGAANPALNRNQVHPIEVTWPHVAKQKALVATLDALDEETQRLATIYARKLTALDDLKKSLLHQAFSGQL